MVALWLCGRLCKTGVGLFLLLSARRLLYDVRRIAQTKICSSSSTQEFYYVETILALARTNIDIQSSNGECHSQSPLRCYKMAKEEKMLYHVHWSSIMAFKGPSIYGLFSRFYLGFKTKVDRSKNRRNGTKTELGRSSL